MKKSTTLLLITCLYLNADILNLTLEESKIDKSSSFLSMKKIQEQQLAKKYFNEAIKQYQSNNYEDALNLFSKVLMIEPDNKRVLFEIAKCNFMLKDYSEAKRLFTVVLNSEVPTEVKENISNILKKIEQLNKKHNFNVNSYVGLLYDSNINNTSSADIFNIYLPLLGSYQMPNQDKKIEDFATEIAASFVYSYKVNEKITLENKLLAYTQRYFEHSEKNINLIGYSFIPTYYLNNNIKLAIEFYKDLIQLDNANFQNNFIIKPSVMYTNLEDLIFETAIVFNNKDYNKEENKQRDVNEIIFSNALTHYSKTWGANKIAVDFKKGKKQRGQRTDVDNKAYAIEYTNSSIVLKDFRLTNSLKYEKIKYEDIDNNFLSKREDKTTSYTFDFSKVIKANLVGGVNYKYMKNDSNHDLFTYDKHISKVYLSYAF